MKRQHYLSLLLACAVIGLLSCGKSAEQKKLEADRNAEVTKLQKTIRTALDGTMRNANAVLATHDSLVAVSPKSAKIHKPDDLKTALEKLNAIKKTVDKWMAVYKPYDPKLSHKDAMAQLNRHKEELVAMKNNLDTAIAQTNKAMANHSKDRKELQNKIGKRVKKPIS